MTNQLKAMMLGVIVVLAFLIMPESKAADPIVTDSTSVVTTTGNQTTTVKSPPPSAIAPQFGGSNSDLCTISSSGSVQTQILGISLGATYTEENCLRLKKAQKLYVFGMKVAAVSVMCQDFRVFDSMMKAGTPCPIEGKIGEEAKELWSLNPKQIPEKENVKSMDRGEFLEKLMSGILGVILLAILAA